MKSNKAIIFLTLALAGFTACKKDDPNQLTGDVNQLGRGAYLTLAKANKLWIDPAKAATETVSVDVSGYGKAINNIDTYVSIDGSLDKAQWRKVKTTAVGADQKATITVSVGSALTQLGIDPLDFEAGDEFTLFNEITTTDGQKFSIINTNGDFESNPNYNQALRFSVIGTGAVDFNDVPGTYTVIVDQWVDYFPDDPIDVDADPAKKTVTIIDWLGTAVNHKDLVLNVDPTSGVATAPKYVAGRYSSTGSEYSVSTVGANNFVISAAGKIILRLNITTPVADQGAYRLILQL